jgi:broad specificity phosphatase PhoE
MRLYVIRHGQSTTNRDKRWTGWLDVSLTEKGRQDALAARDYLSRVHFDKVFTSDLQRARNTAEIALPGMEYEVLPTLREINVGSVAGFPFAETTVPKKEDGTNDYYAIGGESDEEFQGRILSFLEMAKTLPYENIAVFSHAGVLRTMFKLCVGAPIPFTNILCQNCTIAIFELVDDVWKVHSWINMI